MRPYHKGRMMGCPGYQIEYWRIDNSYYHNGASHPIGGFLSCRNISTGDRAVQRVGAIMESSGNQKT